ncbi:hypothetical protein T08_9515 [Trichinella sp. T8]|nr:hypothetical protein T08_9515 [Trichinella sp. T8]
MPVTAYAFWSATATCSRALPKEFPLFAVICPGDVSQAGFLAYSALLLYIKSPYRNSMQMIYKNKV